MSNPTARPANTVARALGAAILALGVGAPLVLPALAPTASAQSVRGHSDPQAEAFVQAQANRVLVILNNPDLGPQAKKQAIYDLVNQIADVPRITDFVLGRYRRSLTPAQYAAFSQAFRQYADSVYETRLSLYHGQQLRVTGSVQRQPGDDVVSSVVTGGGQPATVEWRVLRGTDGAWKIVDVNAEGVWLAVVEQQDFTSTLANAHGDVDVLIGQLHAQAAKGAMPSRR